MNRIRRQFKRASRSSDQALISCKITKPGKTGGIGTTPGRPNRFLTDDRKLSYTNSGDVGRVRRLRNGLIDACTCIVFFREPHPPVGFRASLVPGCSSLPRQAHAMCPPKPIDSFHAWSIDRSFDIPGLRFSMQSESG